MSGSGDSHYGGEGGAGGLPSSNISCTGIFEKTIINSPQEEVISKLDEGDVLDIIYQDEILLACKDGQVAGSLTLPIAATIVHCIEQGHEYVAIVISVDDGACQVEVRVKGH